MDSVRNARPRFAGDAPEQVTEAVEQVADQRQDVAQQQTLPSVWDTGAGLAGGNQQDAMALFGLLAQYGDPQQAATSYLAYQQGQQRLQMQAQAQQARSSGFNIIWDDQNQGWFPHRDPLTGRTVLNKALNSDGNQIKRDPATALREFGGGLYGIDTRGPTAGDPRQIIDPGTAGRGEAERQYYIEQGEAQRRLPGIESSISQSIAQIDGLLEHEATDFMTGAVSGPVGNIVGEIPILGGLTGTADWKDRRDQLRSTAFVNGIIGIKNQAGGIGPISDRESKALEQSLLRAQRATDPEAFNAAMADLRMRLASMLREARGAAGFEGDTPTTEYGVDLRTQEQIDDAAVGADNVSDEDQKLVDQYLRPQGGT